MKGWRDLCLSIGSLVLAALYAVVLVVRVLIIALYGPFRGLG